MHEEASLNDEAIALYRELVQTADDCENHRLFGECLIKIGKPQEAAKEFQLAVDLAESAPELIELVGFLERNGLNDLVPLAAKKASQLKSTWQEQIQLAELLASQGNSVEALAMLRRAAEAAGNSLAWNPIWDAQFQLLVAEPKFAERLRGERSSINDEEVTLAAAALGQMNAAAEMAHQIASGNAMSPRAWAFAAWIDQRAKRTLQEIDSLQRLAAIDAERRLGYLERIAALQFQTNQMDAANETVKQLLNLPEVGVRQYQLAWSFQLQAKDEASAVQTMKAAVQRFPRERAAWQALAQHLASPGDANEAIDAAWQGLFVSTEESLQRESLKSLIDLYRKRGDVSELLRRLASMAESKAQPKQNLDRWTAWSLADLPKADVADDFAQRLISSTSNDPVVLRAAVQIAVDRMKWDEALLLQKRLLSNKREMKDRLRLVELLVLAGDVEAARREWGKLLDEKSNSVNVVEFVRHLASRQQWKVTAALVTADIELDVWEVLAHGMHAHWMSDSMEQAIALADRILALKLAAPSKSVDDDKSKALVLIDDRLGWLEHAGPWQEMLNETSVTRSGYRVDPSDPRSAQAALVRKLALERGASLKSNRVEQLSLRNYGDARALAVLLKFGKAARTRSGESEWREFVEKAIRDRDVAMLWDCVLVLGPSQSKSTGLNGDETGSREAAVATDASKSSYSEILQLLVEADEPHALELAIRDIVASYQLRHQMAARLNEATPRMSAPALTKLRDYIQRSGVRKQDPGLISEFILAIESERERGEMFDWTGLDQLLSKQTDPARIANCISQFALNEDFLREAAQRGLLRLFELEMRSVDASMLPLTIELMGRWADQADKNSLLRLLDATLSKQAEHWVSLNRDQQFVDAHLIPPAYQFRTGEDRKRAAQRPDRSSAMSTSLLLVIDLCFDRVSDDEMLKVEVGPDSAQKKVEYGLRWYAVSVRQAARGEGAAAIDAVNQAEGQVPSSELLKLYRAKLLTANQQFAKAKELLASIEPWNEFALRAIEVVRFEIAKQENDKEELSRSAQVLSKMPLSVRELAEVAAAQSTAKP